MKYESSALLLALGLASAGPVRLGRESVVAREVPQEHSHNFVLDLVRTSLNTNNPQNIQDSVFGLLGNAAAKAGAGTVTNTDCLQQATADQAFTNAKAAGDIPGMAGALLYRAIERNTGGVGVASVICNETAANPEIAALTQHQDPASANAASTNKAITLELAKQLASVGADPLLALDAGTFAPGSTSDSTGKGNSCDTEADEPGCIFTQKLLVLDATEAEISAAVAGINAAVTGTGVLSATQVDFAGLTVGTGVASADAAATGAGAGGAANTTAAADAAACSAPATVAAAANSAVTSSCSVITTTVPAGASSTLSTSTTAASTAASDAASTSTNVASGTNLQTFTGTLGGAPPPVTSSATDRPFSVNGNTFLNLGAALTRSCDIQHNACANAANSGSLSGGVDQCETQVAACDAAAKSSVAKFKRATEKRATDFGSCGNPTILFEAGLDGRNTEAFIAEDQTDFNHGSALNIAVIAGFICQRLGSPCNAPADVQASCTSASAAAVATTQNQAAADAFNNALGVGSGSESGAAATTPDTASTTASSLVMTITQCS